MSRETKQYNLPSFNNFLRTETNVFWSMTIKTRVEIHLWDLVFRVTLEQIVIAMIRTIFSYILQNIQLTFETLEKQLIPNLPFSPTTKIKPLRTIPEPASKPRSVTRIENMPDPFDWRPPHGCHSLWAPEKSLFFGPLLWKNISVAVFFLPNFYFDS